MRQTQMSAMVFTDCLRGHLFMKVFSAYETLNVFLYEQDV